MVFTQGESMIRLREHCYTKSFGLLLRYVHAKFHQHWGHNG